jgi:hypothetical protein
MNPISFDGTPEIKNHCLKLEADPTPGEAPPDLRGKFIFTIKFFAASLLLRANDANAQAAEVAKAVLDR